MDRKTINIILIILFVAGILMLGYFILSRNKDKTANWTIYRSDEYGFEVKYPPTWGLLYPDDGSDIHLTNYPTGEAGTNPDEVIIEIQAFRTKPSNIDLFAFAESQLSPSDETGPTGELTKTDLHGLSVIKIDHSGGEGADGPGYYIEKSPDKFFYVLVYGQTFAETADRIVSTIKFIE